MDVALVTDSSACLPPETAAQHGVRVLPLHVFVGDRGAAGTREGTGPEDVVALLRHGRARVSTSRVSPGELETAYRELRRTTGCRSIVSAHLSAGVSGTVEAACLAADAVRDEVEVTVIDSRSVGLALGWAVLDGAARAAEGGDAGAVSEVVRERLGTTRAWFYVDSLEHLRRGGRLGRAQALLGSALSIKPLLTIEGGQVAAAEKVRTRAKALARLVDLAAEECARVADGGRAPRLAVHELDAAAAAHELADVLRERTGLDVEVVALDLSVGVHTGPGTLGVIVGARGPAGEG